MTGANVPISIYWPRKYKIVFAKRRAGAIVTKGTVGATNERNTINKIIIDKFTVTTDEQKHYLAIELTKLLLKDK